ncbi:MAG: type II toxin-antitoxin system VapC family toxin [Burkholderiales bacterium]
MNFVLDASVTMCWLLFDGKSTARAFALEVLDAMKQAATNAHVPLTWGLEVSNVIAKAEARGLLTAAQSGAFIEMLESVNIAADSATFSKALTDTLQIARRYRLSAYDASYLELALRESLPLATLDADLHKAAQKAGVKRFTGKVS